MVWRRTWTVIKRAPASRTSGSGPTDIVVSGRKTLKSIERCNGMVETLGFVAKPV